MLLTRVHIVRHYMFCLPKGKLNISNCKPNLLQIRFNVGIINKIHEAKKSVWLMQWLLRFKQFK